MAREFFRSDRVAAQMQRELAAILQTDIKDPRLGFVTVNAVQVSRDLALAKIYVSVLNADPDEQALNVEILNHAAPYVRHQLAARMRMRVVSELRFVHDDSIDRGMRIDAILDQLHSEADGKA